MKNQIKGFEPNKNEQREQKKENYQEFGMQLFRYQKIFGKPVEFIEDKSSLVYGYKPWTAYWDMKKDLQKLKRQMFSQKEGIEQERIRGEYNELHKKRRRYVHEIIFHDIIDHIFNGQYFSVISDKINGLADNSLIDTVSGGFADYLKSERFGEKISIKINKYFENYPDVDEDDNPVLIIDEVFKLLPIEDYEKIVELVEKSQQNGWMEVEGYEGENKEKFYSRFLYELQQSPFSEMLMRVSQEFVRLQVYRGLLAANSNKFIKKYLETVKNVGDLNGSELDMLSYFTMEQQGNLAREFAENPEIFDDYDEYKSNSDSYLADILKNNTLKIFADKGPYILEKMKEDLYDDLYAIFDDYDFEKVVRKIAKTTK